MAIGFESIVEGLGRQLTEVRRMYAEALELSRSDDPMKNVIRIFDRTTYGDEGVTAKPYQPFVEGVWVGVNKDANVGLHLSGRPSVLARTPEAVDLEIAVRGKGAPRWLTLEIEVPLTRLRLARRVTASLFGSSKRSEAKEETPNAKSEMKAESRVEIFVWDKSGKRHRAASQTMTGALEDDLGQLRCDAAISLPNNIRLDESRPAILAVFFPETSQRIRITDFYMDFN